MSSFLTRCPRSVRNILTSAMCMAAVVTAATAKASPDIVNMVNINTGAKIKVNFGTPVNQKGVMSREDYMKLPNAADYTYATNVQAKKAAPKQEPTDVTVKPETVVVEKTAPVELNAEVKTGNDNNPPATTIANDNNNAEKGAPPVIENGAGETAAEVASVAVTPVTSVKPEEAPKVGEPTPRSSKYLVQQDKDGNFLFTLAQTNDLTLGGNEGQDNKGQFGGLGDKTADSFNKVDFSGALEYWGNPNGAGAGHLRGKYTYKGGSVGYTHIALLPGAKGVEPFYMVQSYATVQFGNQQSAPQLHIGQRNLTHLDPIDITNYGFNAHNFRPFGTGVFLDTYNPKTMDRTRFSAYNEVGGDGNKGVLQVDQQFSRRVGKDGILWGEGSLSTRNGMTGYLFTQYQQDRFGLNAQLGWNNKGGGVSLGATYEVAPNLYVGLNYNNYHFNGRYADRWQNELRGSVFYKAPVNDRYWFGIGIDTRIAGAGNSGGFQARPVLTLGVRF